MYNVKWNQLGKRAGFFIGKIAALCQVLRWDFLMLLVGNADK